MLSAANSLYATTYSWSIFSGAGPVVTLANSNSVTPTFTAPNGTYVLQLVVGNGTTQSTPVQVKVTIDSTMGTGGKFPAIPKFADIKAVLQGPPGCSSCHQPNGGPPIYYIDAVDRNGDGITGSQASPNSIDDNWFWTELRGRINFTDVAASPLLRRPTSVQHGAGYIVLDPNDTTSCSTCGAAYTTYGAYNAAAYNMFVNWILNGAPY